MLAFGCYTWSRDPLLGDVLKVLVGATGGVFTGKSSSLIVGSDAQSKAIVSEFLSK
jgi:hypothetical protein